MEKYNYDFPCEFNPRLKAKIDYFLGKCSVLDGKDTRLYALANDVLEEELKSFFYDANEKHGNAVYSKLLQDNSFRKYIKSAGIDYAFLDRIYMLKNSPYDFFPTDSFLEKEKLIEGVFNTLKSIYNRKSPEAKADCISEEKVKPVIMRDDSACCKKEEADISPSTPDMHFSDEFSQDELFQSSIGDDTTEQVGDNIEKISTENEEEQSRNQVTLETNAESQESNESLILKCQNVIFQMLKEDGKKDLSQCDKESCQKIIYALELILPNGLTIKSNREKTKYTLESIDLNYSQKSCSKTKDNYLRALRGFISWILLKPLNKKTNSQASQNDIKSLQTLKKYYEAISRIIIAKYGDDYFFYIKEKTPHLKDKKCPRINEFKELIFKLNEDVELKNRIHIKFSIELNYSYIRIKELGIYLYTQQYSKGATKKKCDKISDLIWRFYKLVLQKSNYCPSAMLNRQ